MLGNTNASDAWVARQPAGSDAGAGDPPPSLGVLILDPEPAGGPDDLGAIAATIAAVARGGEHPLRAVVRSDIGPAGRALLLDLERRLPSLVVVTAPGAESYAARASHGWRHLETDWVCVLRAGVLPAPDTLLQLVATATAAGADLARPAVLDTAGKPRAADDSAGACVLVRRRAIPTGALSGSAYATAWIWRALESQLPATALDRAATVLETSADGAGADGRAGAIAFDRSLARRGVAVVASPPPRRVLLVAPRGTADCVAALGRIAALAAHAPLATLAVLCGTDQSWVFEHHPAVDRVLRFDRGHASEERAEAVLERLVTATPYDRLVVLDDGDPSDARSRQLTLGTDDVAAARSTLAALGLEPPYAVASVRCDRAAGPSPLLAELVDHLAGRHDLCTAVVGTAGELIAHPLALNLAGHLRPAQAAAVVGGAAVAIGADPDLQAIAVAQGVPFLRADPEAPLAETAARLDSLLESTRRGKVIATDRRAIVCTMMVSDAAGDGRWLPPAEPARLDADVVLEHLGAQLPAEVATWLTAVAAERGDSAATSFWLRTALADDCSPPTAAELARTAVEERGPR